MGEGESAGHPVDRVSCICRDSISMIGSIKRHTPLFINLPIGPRVPHRRIVTKAMQRYWRLSRPLTLGAQGVVIDGEDRVLLIRHSYRPGWHFPGGGVEKGESLLTALTRELHEEAGIELTGRPRLFNVYANFRLFPGDHVALFVVRDWKQPRVPSANREIAEQGFFRLSRLPPTINASTRARLSEVLEGAAIDEAW